MSYNSPLGYSMSCLIYIILRKLSRIPAAPLTTSYDHNCPPPVQC